LNDVLTLVLKIIWVFVWYFPKDRYVP